MSGFALKRDVASHRPRETTADRETQTSTALASLGLTELLEDGLMLICLDAASGVAHRYHETRVCRAAGLHLHLAVAGELECVPEEVDEDLADPLSVEHDLRGCAGV